MIHQTTKKMAVRKDGGQVDQTISHYKILEKLGEGGMGIVYKAHDAELNRIVALKFLPHYLTSDSLEKERFYHEARAASALNHPNITTIHEVKEFENPATAGKQLYIAMEYVEGKTLKVLIEHEILPIKKVLDIAIQVCDGLAAAHEKGIVHRDIKSENIMLTPKGQAKIMDFGLAKVKGSTKLTKEGSTLGTAAYMSPEQAQGEEVDYRSDIFSFGVVLYELLTGKLPFRGEHHAALMYSIINEEPPPIARFNEKVTPEIERIVSRALAKDKEDRYQHADDLLAELRHERKKLEYAKTGYVSAPITVPTMSASKRWKIGAGGLAAVIIIGLGIYFFIFKTKAIDSIAVLPFINVNADSTLEYLSDGITENLINSLTQLSNLRVIPRSTAFHYKWKDIDPREVGNTLKVRSLLTGRVIQRGSELNIQLDLIDIKTEAQIWGAQYNRKLSDLASVQDEIVRGVSQKLQPGLSGAEKMKMSRGHTNNPEAFQLYMKGRFYWNKRTTEGMKASVGYFEQAIEKDPMYALAYAGLADAYLVLGSWTVYPKRETTPKAKTAVLKALEIDNELAEAHTSLAGVLENEWDWSGAEREYQRSIELNPNYPTGHQWYAEFLALLGRHQEALSEILKAQELDPLSLIINSSIGQIYNNDRQYDKAIEQCRKVFEMDSNFAPAQTYFQNAYFWKGMNNQELDEVNRIQMKAGTSRANIEAFNRIYRSAGSKGVARLYLTQLDTASKYMYISSYNYASAYAIIGEKERALHTLEKSIDEREHGLDFLKVDPAFDSLRSDPRFIAILKKVGLDK
jgi:serine/threonine protein kinase/Tfp pilus assembly protein PilF